MSNDEIIEFVLYHVKEIETAIYEKKLDPCIPRSVGGHSKISDITATKAMQNISEIPCVVVEHGAKFAGHGETQVIKRPEMWLRAVKYLDEIYKGKTAEEFIRRRYTDNEPYNITCHEMGIGKNIYYAYRADVIRACELYAVGNGLLPWKRC